MSNIPGGFLDALDHGPAGSSHEAQVTATLILNLAGMTDVIGLYEKSR